jgi:uncharacterized protein YkwD
MDAWMNSPGHRANTLSPYYNKIGVGLYVDEIGVKYLTQIFMD